MILSAETFGRNEPCHCKSGKKYKKCCMVIDERRAKPKQINQNGMMAVFRSLIFEAGVSYKITCEDLAMIPLDEGIKIHYEPIDDSFVLSVVKLEKKSPIIQPNKRIIT